MKKYKFSIVTGRFGHFTKGHEYLVQQAIDNSEKVMILVGSAQEKGTFRNPFSVETKIKLIQRIYPPETTNVIVVPLPDMTHEDDVRPAWGRFFLDYVNRYKEEYGITSKTEAMYYGHDEDRNHWFSKTDKEGMDLIPIQRGVIDISATKMRMFLAKGQRVEWQEYANSAIHDMFDDLKQELIQTLEYGQISRSLEREGVSVLYQNKTESGRIRNSILETNWQNTVKWVYSHNDWCYGAAVVVLPYRIKADGNFEYLARIERCPAHSSELELGVVMGGYDKADKVSMAGHAKMELEEEAGYRVHESKLIPLGTVRPEKSSDTTHYLYAINVNQKGVKKVPATGDGSIIEMDGYTEWVDEKTAAFSKMSVFSTLILRLKHHLAANN